MSRTTTSSATATALSTACSTNTRGSFETAGALAELEAARCDLVQGYLLGRPMDAAALRTLIGDSDAGLPLEGTYSGRSPVGRLG